MPTLTDNRSDRQNRWVTVRTGDIVKAQFPCIFAGVIETPWCTGKCRATSCLSCTSTLSKLFPRFHSNYTANVVFQGQDIQAFFIHQHEQARNVRKSFRQYRSSWLKKYMWVSRGIELYPQNGAQAAVVDAWAVHGKWWISGLPEPCSWPEIENCEKRPVPDGLPCNAEARYRYPRALCDQPGDV